MVRYFILLSTLSSYVLPVELSGNITIHKRELMTIETSAAFPVNTKH